MAPHAFALAIVSGWTAFATTTPKVTPATVQSAIERPSRRPPLRSRSTASSIRGKASTSPATATSSASGRSATARQRVLGPACVGRSPSATQCSSAASSPTTQSCEQEDANKGSTEYGLVRSSERFVRSTKVDFPLGSCSWATTSIWLPISSLAPGSLFASN